MKKEVKQKDRRTNSKKILIVFAVLVILIVALLCIVLLLPKEPSSSPNGYYYPADYEEDIFKNPVYREYERGLLYEVNGVTQLFQYETDYEEASDECKFFLDYFQTIINGEYELLSAYYVDDYFEEEPMFTMQMLYDPYVSFHSSETEEIDGVETDIYNFRVQYKIFKNNGTFRKVASNTAVPQIYQLIKVGNCYRILRILDIQYEY